MSGPPATLDPAKAGPPTADLRPGPRPWQRWLFRVIFEHDTWAGRAFDLTLLAAIVLSVIIVALETVQDVRIGNARLLYGLEWFFTILFSIEYVLRLACVERRRSYALSFFGVVDLLAILPTYLSLLVPGTQGLATVRGLRLLRIFRVLKLTQFVQEASTLRAVVWASRPKITVFLMTVLIVACIVGAAMYVIEGPRNDGFSSIPSSIYWAIVTMATVGYGDIVPKSPAGKLLSAVLIVFGFSLIVVPTSILSAEFAADAKDRRAAAAGARKCPSCGAAGHDADAVHCKWCGEPL